MAEWHSAQCPAVYYLFIINLYTRYKVRPLSVTLMLISWSAFSSLPTLLHSFKRSKLHPTPHTWSAAPPAISALIDAARRVQAVTTIVLFMSKLLSNRSSHPRVLAVFCLSPLLSPRQGGVRQNDVDNSTG